jgi:hypothetical protein
MKKYCLNKLPVIGVVLMLVIVLNACKKENGIEKLNIPGEPPIAVGDTALAAKNAALRAYKQSKHFITMGFVVADGNDPSEATNLLNQPDSLDMVYLFTGYDTDPTHWRAIQDKGTKIIRTEFPSAAYFDGSAKDPDTKLPGYVAPPGLDPNNPTPSSTYNHYAKNKYFEYIYVNKWDGIDFDIESGAFGGDVPASNAKNFLDAMARYFGPNCTNCIVGADGKKPLLTYDTDVAYNGTTISPDKLYLPYKSNYDYVLFQSYTTGNRAWGGVGVQSLGSLVDLYGGEKMIFLVNGDSFVYPDGVSQDRPGEDAKASKDLLDYAHYVKDNKGTKGIGVGAYRMSRDYNHTPPWKYTREAIQIMNPK